jgi:hypothetical protein
MLAATPDKGVAMRVPIGGGVRHRLADRLPRLEAAALKRQRAHHLPPRLDPIEVGGIGWLEDELPARVGQRPEQDVGRPVGGQVVEDGVDPLRLGPDPGIDLLPELNPVGDGAALIGDGQRRAGRRVEGTEDIAAAPPRPGSAGCYIPHTTPGRGGPADPAPAAVALAPVAVAAAVCAARPSPPSPSPSVAVPCAPPRHCSRQAPPPRSTCRALPATPLPPPATRPPALAAPSPAAARPQVPGRAGECPFDTHGVNRSPHGCIAFLGQSE